MPFCLLPKQNACLKIHFKNISLLFDMLSKAIKSSLFSRYRLLKSIDVTY